MRRIATYSSYEEANDDQITLLAANIDALVEYRASPPLELAHLQPTGGYELLVASDQFETAFQILRREPDPKHVPISACPHCRSEEVADRPPPNEGLSFLLLFIPTLVYIYRRRTRGVPFRCYACGRNYRVKV